MIHQLFKIGSGCPIYQLYFESGHFPAMFHAKRMKVVFYHYILQQKENSLLLPFLMAQQKEPRGHIGFGVLFLFRSI